MLMLLLGGAMEPFVDDVPSFLFCFLTLFPSEEIEFKPATSRAENACVLPKRLIYKAKKGRGGEILQSKIPRETRFSEDKFLKSPTVSKSCSANCLLHFAHLPSLSGNFFLKAFSSACVSGYSMLSDLSIFLLCFSL